MSGQSLRLLHRLVSWLRGKSSNESLSRSLDSPDTAFESDSILDDSSRFSKILTQAERQKGSSINNQQLVSGDHNMNVMEVGGGSVVTRDIFAESVVIGSRPHKTNVPRQTPILPLHFVKRPEHYDAIKSLLLSKEASIPGTLVVSAIYGLGGIGKSTLAAAVAHDPDVKANFQDGTLWVTLGQQPDTLSFLNDWIRELSDDYQPTTLEAASKRLRTLLHDKRVLLVIDDVWHPKHVEQFRVGGMACRVLITTRQATIPSATRYDLNVMEHKEALELLTKRISSEDLQASKLSETEQRQAVELADAVGYLPLALELAAVQIADGVSWANLLAALREEVARLEAFDLPGEKSDSEEAQKNRSLKASFNLSLRSLPSDQQVLFSWLGVLPEDVTITSAMTATLWAVNQQESASILRSLQSKALLTQAEKPSSYKLHDLLHLFACSLLTISSELQPLDAANSLGLSLSEAHAILLNRYRSRTCNGSWHTLQDDGYIHSHLVWHLERAGLVDEIHALLSQEDEAGQNGWYEARRQLGQVSGYLADINRAWHLTETTSSNPSAFSLGLQCRYALITASLNSLTGNIPPALMIALVDKELWNPLDGLLYIEQMRSPDEQVETLKQLLPLLPMLTEDKVLQRVLLAVRKIKPECDRAIALASLATRLSHLQQGQILSEALLLAESFENNWELKTSNFLDALINLELPLSETFLQTLLRRASSNLTKENTSIQIWQKLIPLLTKPLLQQALRNAQQIEDPYQQAEALHTLVPYLSQLSKEQALEELLKSLEVSASKTHGRDLAEALLSIAAQFSELMEGNILNRIMRLTHYMSSKSDSVRVLSALSNHLPKAKRKKLIRQISTISFTQDEYVSTLLTLESKLSEPNDLQVLRRKLREALSFVSKANRIKIIKAISLHLSDSSEQQLQQKVLDAAHSFQSASERVKALIAVLPHLSEPLRENTLQSIRAMIRDFEDESEQAEQLLSLSCCLPKFLREEILKEALLATQKIKDESKQVEQIISLAPHLSGSLRQEASKVIKTLKSEVNQTWVHNELEPGMTEIKYHDLERRCQEIASAMQHTEEQRAQDQSTQDNEDEAENNLLRNWENEARNLNEIEDEITRLEVLKVHNSHLPPIKRQRKRQNNDYKDNIHTYRGRQKTQIYTRSWWRHKSVAAIRIAVAVIVRLSQLFLALVRKLLIEVAVCLPKKFREVFKVLGHLFTVLTSRLQKSKVRRLSWYPVIYKASCIEDENQRVEILNALALKLSSEPLLSFERWRARLHFSRLSTKDKITRAKTLGVLSMQLSISSQQEFIWNSFRTAISIREDVVAFQALMALISCIPEEDWGFFLSEGTFIALGIQNDCTRNVALRALAQYQSYFNRKILIKNVLPFVRKIEDESIQRAALEVLSLSSEPSEASETRQRGEKITQVKAMETLASHAPYPANERIAWQAFELAQTLEDESARIKAFLALTPYLSWTLKCEILVEKVFRQRQITTDQRQKAGELLIALAPYFSLRQESLKAALRVARSVVHNDFQAWVLRRILPLLPDSVSWKVLRSMLISLKPDADKSILIGAVKAFFSNTTILLSWKLRQITQVDFYKETLVRLICTAVPMVRRLTAEGQSFERQLLYVALTTLQSLSNSCKQLELLLNLVKYIPNSTQQEILNLVLNSLAEEDPLPSEVLGILISHLPQSLQQECIGISRELKDANFSARALATLAPHLAEPMKEEARQGSLSAIQLIRDEKEQAETLSKVAVLMPEKLRHQLQREVLSRLRISKDKNIHSCVLATLALDLPKSLLQNALSIAQLIGDESTQAKTLNEFALHLDRPRKELCLDQALAVAKKIQEEIEQARVCLFIAQNIPIHSRECVLGEILDAVRVEISEGNSKIELLALLAPHLTEQMLTEALAIAQTVENLGTRIRTLSVLVGYLPHNGQKLQFLREILTNLQFIDDEGDLAESLTNLAPSLPELLLYEVKSVAKIVLSDGRTWRELLETLAVRFPETLQSEALAAIAAVESEKDSTKVLSLLQSQLPEYFWHEAIEAAATIEDWSTRIKVNGLLDQLTLERHMKELMESLRMNKNQHHRVSILILLLRDRPELLWEAFRAAQALDDHIKRETYILLIVRLAEFLQDEILDEILKAAQRIQSSESRAKVFRSLSTSFLGSTRSYCLQEAFVAGQDLNNPLAKIRFLITLIPHLSESMREQVFYEISSLDSVMSKEEQIAGLSIMAPYIIEKISCGALRREQLSVTGSQEIEVLILQTIKLQELLGEELQERSTISQVFKVSVQAVLRSVQAIEDESTRTKLLILLSQQFSEPIKRIMLHHAMVAAKAFKDKRNRIEALSSLSPHVKEADFKEVFLDAVQIAEDDRAQILGNFVSFLSGLSEPDLYKIWIETIHSSARRSRVDLLEEMYVFIPILSKLGGQEALTEASLAIQDVGRWWR